MDYYKTISDFGTPGVQTLIYSVADAVPGFFALALFLIWLLGSASSYFIILKTTGRKRFFHSLTAMSFVMFLVSLMFASMNTLTVTVISGYWVGFYIVMILLSFYGLNQYK